MVSRPSGHDHTKRLGDLGVSLGFNIQLLPVFSLWRAQKFGKRVVVLPPSSPSVEVLRANGFAQADTFQQFQLSPKLQQTAKGPRVMGGRGRISFCQQLLELQEFAVANDCRLIVTGDTKQHTAFNGAMRCGTWSDRVLSRRPCSPRSIVSGSPSCVTRSKI